MVDDCNLHISDILLFFIYPEILIEDFLEHLSLRVMMIFLFA